MLEFSHEFFVHEQESIILVASGSARVFTLPGTVVYVNLRFRSGRIRTYVLMQNYRE
jgi:hypothetical protein